MLKVVKDTNQPSTIRALALRMLPPDKPGLEAAELRRFVDAPDSGLRSEAVRTLALRADEPSQAVLRELAADVSVAHELRAEAVLGLAHSAVSSAVTRGILLSLLGQPALRLDALRSLRETANRPEVRKAVLACWTKGTPVRGNVPQERT